jgi:hypothetical protein
MSDPTPARAYRFAPLDRSGVLLGLSGRQCAVLGGGSVAAGWLLDRAAPAPLVLAPFLAALVVAFARVGEESMCDGFPTLARFVLRAVTGRHRWFAALPFTGAVIGPAGAAADLPPFMAGLEIIDVGPALGTTSARIAGVGVVLDRRAGTASATLPVHAGGFCLADRADQERLVAGWGDVLGGFCREEGLVSQIRWTEWLAPGVTGPCAGDLEEHGAAETAAEDAYRALLSEAAGTSTGHEVLVTVTVDQRRLRGAGLRRSGRPAATTDVLVEELRLLDGRLSAAGLTVDPPLSPAELTDAIRRRFDPHGSVLPVRPDSLAAAAGVVSALRAAPLATEAAWSHVRVDGTVHRTFWVAEWPRLDVPPNWMEPLILHPGAVRTVSVVYEPVPPGRSRRQVDREATKLASDEEQRARAGFRIGARHRRQQGALVEREAELVAGFGELCFAGFVTVSAASPAALDAACADYTQAAAQVGLDLRRLDGRHDTGLLCALPVGRGVTPRRMP